MLKAVIPVILPVLPFLPFLPVNSLPVIPVIFYVGFSRVRILFMIVSIIPYVEMDPIISILSKLACKPN